MSQDGYERGVRILHFLGGSSIDVAGARAIAQTKMTISQRARVEDVLCDVVCTGRFYDFLEKRDGRWGLVLRQPIYEKDRLDPVDPAARLALDPGLLAQFPEGYRHLAYLQTRIGYKVKTDMPGLDGPEVEALYRRGESVAQGRGVGVRLGLSHDPPRSIRDRSRARWGILKNNPMQSRISTTGRYGSTSRARSPTGRASPGRSLITPKMGDINPTLGS